MLWGRLRSLGYLFRTGSRPSCQVERTKRALPGYGQSRRRNRHPGNLSKLLHTTPANYPLSEPETKELLLRKVFIYLQVPGTRSLHLGGLRIQESWHHVDLGAQEQRGLKANPAKPCIFSGG